MSDTKQRKAVKEFVEFWKDKWVLMGHLKKHFSAAFRLYV